MALRGAVGYFRSGRPALLSVGVPARQSAYYARMLNRLSHTRLLRAAGLYTWALVGIPIILNIWVLSSATRFNGTRITTLMLLANLFLLVWDYDRLKHILPLKRSVEDHHVPATTSKFPIWFFGIVFAAVVSVIAFDDFLYPIRPGNEPLECTNGCKNKDDPGACQRFCDCIYKKGNPLNTCLNEYQGTKEAGAKSDAQVR